MSPLTKWICKPLLVIMIRGLNNRTLPIFACVIAYSNTAFCPTSLSKACSRPTLLPRGASSMTVILYGESNWNWGALSLSSVTWTVTLKEKFNCWSDNKVFWTVTRKKSPSDGDTEIRQRSYNRGVSCFTPMKNIRVKDYIRPSSYEHL